VFVGVISFGSNLCYTGPCSSSLALGCAFWVCWAFSFWFVCCLTLHAMSLVLHIVCWLSMGRFIWLRDRESGSSCNLYLTWFGFLWCTGGEGCPANLVLKSGEPITFDSRSRVSSLSQVRFWAFVLCSFSGSEVARLWKLHDPSVKCSSNCGSAWVLGSGGFILRVFLWGWVVTMGSGGYRVYSAFF